MMMVAIIEAIGWPIQLGMGVGGMIERDLYAFYITIETHILLSNVGLFKFCEDYTSLEGIHTI